jgi:hypothetical protein
LSSIGSFLLAAWTVGSACQTIRTGTELDGRQLAEAVQELGRPLAGNMAALYDLTVPSSGGLRLTVLQRGDSGRVTVNEPFGAAVSTVDWRVSGGAALFDFRRGCRLVESDLAEVAGVSALPIANAVRLLGGRLPAVAGDTVSPMASGRLRVDGVGWSAEVWVAVDPWRVILVEEVVEGGGEGWRIRLRNHSLSLPGWIRFEGAGRRWAELELLRLEWNTVAELPALPALPTCEPSRGGS